MVLSSPHSGRDYPRDFVDSALLDIHALRSSEDMFVDELFGGAAALGLPMIAARYPRAWCDLNRAPDEFDPAVIADLPFGRRSPRAAAGLGVIPRIVSAGRPIRQGKMRFEEAEARMAASYYPYHKTLASMVAAARERFGEVLLLDCHSMPSSSVSAEAEIVIGDRYGASAYAAARRSVVRAFEEAGFRVALNEPFAGGHIAAHYGRPGKGVHAVQVELNRALYMDEGAQAKRAVFGDVRARLTQAVAVIARDWSVSHQLAAE
ncbi:N-formylglutamate amidohydrolase [Paracoccaceae bacterium GXU_MW_L88]